MMRYAATRGDGIQNTLNAIRDGRAFNAGNLTGVQYPSPFVRYTWLPEVWRADWQETLPIAYAVYSYGTPIAWFTGTEWVVPMVTYSATTNRHQSTVRQALRVDGLGRGDARTHTLASLRRAREVFA